MAKVQEATQKEQKVQEVKKQKKSKPKKRVAKASKPVFAGNWLNYLEEDKNVKQVRAVFLRTKVLKLKHWRAYMESLRLSVKKYKTNSLETIQDAIQRIKEWFQNIDWDKWWPILIDVAKVVLPILVLLIL